MIPNECTWGTSVCVTRLGRLVITWSTSVWLDFVVLVALVTTCFRLSDSRAFHYTAWHQMFVVWSYRCLHRLPKSASHPLKQQVHWKDRQVSVTCRRYAFDFQPDIKYCQTEFCCSCFGRERLNHQYSSSAYQRLSIVSKPGLRPRGRRARPRRNGNGVNPFSWKFIYRKSFRGIFFTPS